MEQIDRIIRAIKSLSERQQKVVNLVNGYEERLKALENSTKENRRIIQNQDRVVRNQERTIRRLRNELTNSQNEVSSLKNAVNGMRSR
jgi:predicted RNase H-like nuclease (RuvC/YqgF family)